MRFKYQKHHIDFLDLNFKKMSVPELTQAFNNEFGLNKTANQIKSTLTNHKLRCGRIPGLPKGTSRLFTKSQIEFITEKYQLHKPARVAVLLNKTCNGSFTEDQIKSFVHNHGINCGRTGHFEKGQVPWNTGTKGVMKANEGTFKKGHSPVNTKPVGSERVSVDGYREIKIAEPNKWQLLQRYNWSLKHGTENMPENLRFKDGNKLNCEIENLEPVTNAEHIRITQLGYSQMPAEVKPLIITIAKIDAKAHSLKKRNVA